MRILTDDGIDVLQGLGADRDLAASVSTSLVIGSTDIHPTVDESQTLTLRLDGNTVPSAVIVVDLYYALGV